MSEPTLHVQYGPDRLDLMRSLATSKLQPESRLTIVVVDDVGRKTYHLWVLGVDDTDSHGFRLAIRGRVLEKEYKKGEPEPPDPKYMPREARSVLINYNMQTTSGFLVFT